jgi:hypothetical protein
MLMDAPEYIDTAKKVRDVCKAVKDTTLLQAVSDILMQTVETSAVQRLGTALGTSCTTLQQAKKVLEAYRAAANGSKPSAIIAGLRDLIPQVRSLIVSSLSTEIPPAGIQECKDLYKALAEDTSLFDAATLEVEKNNVSLFLKVVAGVESLTADTRVCKGTFDEADGKKLAFDQLAKHTMMGRAFVTKPPRWVGATKTFSEESLMPIVSSRVDEAIRELNFFGLSEINRRVTAARAAVEKLEELAGGSTAAGRVWSEGLAKDASNEAILASFSTSGLEHADDDNKTTNAIDQMETALMLRMYFSSG